MLWNITLTPTAVWFNNLSDEEFNILCKEFPDYEFKCNAKGVHVSGNPQILYKFLLDLTYKYDVELT